jgi:DNA polymerase-3 subunit beta
MEVDLEASVPADVKSTGSFCLPAHVFNQIVSSLPGEMVSLKFDDKEVEVSSGNYDTRLRLEDPEAGPVISFSENYTGEVAAGALVKALSSVRYAAATADYQAIFRGVKIELGENRMRTVSTDGFRLAYYHSEYNTGVQGDAVAPARSVDEVIRLLSEGTVRFDLTAACLSLQLETYRINVKLMDGTFPDYERVIPESFPVSITVGSELLTEAVSRVALMADKTANNRVDLFIKGGLLQITAEGSYGRSQESLDVSQTGDDHEIALAYNAKYLTDALTSISGDLRIYFSGTSTPSVMASLSDPSYLAMVVPLRTG